MNNFDDLFEQQPQPEAVQKPEPQKEKPYALQGAAVRLNFFPKFRRNGGVQRGRWQKKNMGSRPTYRGHG